jgi:TonB family protein
MKVAHVTIAIFLVVAAGPYVSGQSVPPPMGAANAPQTELEEAARLTKAVAQLYQAGKYDEALPLAEHALEIRQRLLGPDDAATASANSNLGSILNALGKYVRARDAFERALAAFVAKLGDDHAVVNQTREELALVYFVQREYGRARGLLERSLAGREKTLGPDHRLVVRTLVNLAYVYLVTGDSERRDATYSRLLDMAQKSPEETLEFASKLFSDYVCTGATHPYASDRQKEIEGRIQQLWYARKYGAGPANVISGGVLAGRALAKPQPGYPLAAKQGRVQGTVVVKVTVDEIGKVVEAEPLCGPSGLHGASVQAAKGWRFTPTLVNGVPVKVTGTITFNFVLQ